VISGRTVLVAHIGYPTEAFKAPMIYNPYFEQAGVDAVVVPMGVRADDYPDFLRRLVAVTNLRGALVTMPHKVTTVALADEVTPTAAIAGAANALLRTPAGTLVADMFDGEGFVRGVLRKGRRLAGATRWSSAAAAWGARSPRRSPPRAWPGSGCSTPSPRRRRPSANGSPGTTPTWP